MERASGRRCGLVVCGALILAMLWSAIPASAHHGWGGYLDETTDISGTVESSVSLATRSTDETERAWDAFYRLYLGTSDRKWGSAYLTRRFFSMLGERMPEKIVLFMARRA